MIDAKLEPEQKWFAVVTRYRNEKAVASRLTEKGIRAYLPLKKIVREYASRKKVHQVPLFNCYVFVKIKLNKYPEVLETPSVLHFIKFGGEFAEIPEREIDLLRLVSEKNYHIDVLKQHFKEGDAVQVVAGPLKGIQGKLIKINNRKRFVVEFEKINRSVAIEIDSGVLENLSS